MSQRPSFMNQLQQAWTQQDSMLCVGLDPDITRMPQTLCERHHGLLEFCQAIVDATAPLVCAFKAQIACFSALAEEASLTALIEYVHARHPDIPVILDAKRGDIGATARRYAEEAFVRYGADAVTVNPFLGKESLEPFLEHESKGVIMLCRTSNAGSGWLQTFPEDDPLYLRVARAAVQWNERGNLMLVAGATYPHELKAIRKVVGDMPLLVPGIGAQGGDLAAVLENGCDSQGRGLMINVSRAVLYAGEEAADYGTCFAESAATAARELLEEMRSYPKKT